MANERLTLEAVLEARNLTGQAFDQLEKSIKTSDASLKSLGQTGHKAGDDLASGAKKAADGFDLSKTKVGGLVEAIGSGLGVNAPLAIGAAITAVVALGVQQAKSFGEFEKNMRGVSSLLVGTARDADTSFEGMSRQVREFAVRVGVDANEAARGLYETISAGVPAGKQAFNVLEVASKAAIAGFTQTAVAVDGITSVLNAYKLPASDAAKVSDQLFQVVNDGKVTFEQLAASIGGVTPIASAAGVQFNEVGGFIANYTKQGNSAGEATAALRQVIQSFIKPTDEARKAADALGIQFDAQTLRSRGLAGAMNYVAEAAGGDQEALAMLFGDLQGLQGVLASTGVNFGGLTQSIDKVTESTGVADLAFQEIEKSGVRAWDHMAAKFGDVGLKIGEVVSGPALQFLEFVDKVGESLGLWPADVPPKEQVDRFDSLTLAARGTAEAINLLSGHYQRLIALRAAEWIGGQVQSVRTAAAQTNAYADAEARLTAEVTAGGEGAAEAARQLSALRQARDAASKSLSTYTEESDRSTQSTEAGALAYAQAAQAQIDADRAAAEASAAAAAKDQQSIRDRIKAQEDAAKEAKRISDEQARAIKQATDQARREAEQHAKDIARANDDAAEAWRKYQRDVADAVEDGLDRVREIQRRHDDDYNAAIQSAIDEQTAIKERAAADLVRLEEDRVQRVLELEERLADVQEGRNREAVDRQRRLQREQEDLDIAAEERRQERDRQRAERELERRKVASQAAAEADQTRGDADADRLAARKRFDDQLREDQKRSGDDLSEESKRHDREVAEHQRQLDREVADARRDHDKAVAAELKEYQRALRDADTDDERARIEERHKDAVQKEADRHAEALAKAQQRFDDQKAKEDLQHADALEKIRKRDEEAKERREAAYRDALQKIDGQEQAELARIAQGSQARLAAINEAEQRQLEADQRNDQREEARRTLAKKRDEEDFRRRQTEAADQLKADIEAVNKKAAARALEIATARDLDVQASNDALVKKQAQIDKARDDDFVKFQQQTAKRLREMEQQFGDSMRRLNDLIPARVSAVLGAAHNLTEGAGDQLDDASQPSGTPGGSSSAGSSSGADGGQTTGGSAPADDGQTWDNLDADTKKLFEDTHGDNARDEWERQHADELAKKRGQGAGNPDAYDYGSQAAYDEIVERYRSRLRAIQDAADAGLMGGDLYGGTDYAPSEVNAQSGEADAALAWAQQRLGDKRWVNLCQAFVENAFGTGGVYPSAKDAAAALMTSRGGGLKAAPRGQLVFFAPDASNAYYGHVGISMGGGRFISSTTAGVTVDSDASRYWSSLYQGWGAPRFGQRRKYAQGGWIDEHVIGVGQQSGDVYEIGEVPGKRELVLSEDDARQLDRERRRTGGGDRHVHHHYNLTVHGAPAEVRDVPALERMLHRMEASHA